MNGFLVRLFMPRLKAWILGAAVPIGISASAWVWDQWGPQIQLIATTLNIATGEQTLMISEAGLAGIVTSAITFAVGFIAVHTIPNMNGTAPTTPEQED